MVETGEEGRLYSMGRILTLEIVHFSVFLSDKGSYIVTETCPPCLPAKFHSAFIVFFTNAKMFSSLLVGWLVVDECSRNFRIYWNNRVDFLG